MKSDPDRLNRIHVTNVRYDSNKKQYLVSLYNPRDEDRYEVTLIEWLKEGTWEKRKSQNSHF